MLRVGTVRSRTSCLPQNGTFGRVDRPYDETPRGSFRPKIP
jgi:hypothetical protein